MEPTTHSKSASFRFDMTRRRTGSGLWIGLSLVLFGLGWLLDVFDVLSFGSLLRTWWPTVLMVIAAIQLATRSGSATGSAVLFGIGALLQLSKLNLLPGGFWSAFWPLVVIIIDISLISPYLRNRPRRASTPGFPADMDASTASATVNDDARVDQTALFSSAELRVTSQGFVGGELSAIFGGIEIDLREAAIAGPSALLRATAIFGGIEITVPSSWRVVVTGTPVFGGVDNRTQFRTADPHGPTLLLDVTAVFGGIEIR